ncbi:MAG: hypothetical protein H0Z24_05985 [Thermosipho sp. (in: Bacteria)]|nr:hypothetical protein [Thermosipho sp. (in: thermotogales)]
MPIKINRGTDVKVPPKEVLLENVKSQVNEAHLMASMEYMFDLMLDMMFKVIDTMVANGEITLTPEEQATYDSLKQAQSNIHTFDLQNSQFPNGRSVVDYMYYFKDIIKKRREEYFKIKQKFNIE